MLHTHHRLASVALLLAAIASACGSPGRTKEEYLAQGNAYVAKGQYAAAIIEFRSALKQDGRFWQAHDRLADTYLKVRDGERALRAAVLAADLHDDDALQVRAARFLLASGRYEDARARAGLVSVRDPRNLQAMLLKAQAMIGLRDLSSALELLDEAAIMDPDDARSDMIKAAVHSKMGSLAEAEAIFSRAVESHPTSLDAQLGLANFYWTTDRRAEAEQSLRAAIALAPQNVIAQRALATFLVSTGRGAEAEAAFKAVVAADPSAQSRAALADHYIAQHRFDEARSELARLATASDGFSAATTRLASLDYARGDKAAAYKQLEDVLARDAKDVDALVLKARLLLNDGKGDAALVQAKAAVAAEPQSPQAQFLLGRVLVNRGDVADAIAAFTEAARLRPNVASPQIQIAQLRLQTGNTKAAEAAVMAALNLSPTNVSARLLMARIAIVNDNLARAGTEMERLVVEQPNEATVHSQMGELRVLQKNFTEARREFDRALAIDASNMNALRGLIALDIGERQGDRAQAAIEARLEAAPDDPELLRLAANTYEATGDVVRREQYLRRLIVIDPSRSQTFADLARLYVEQNKLDEAKTQFEAILAKAPRSVGAATMVGLILESQGKTAEAMKAYEKAVAIDQRAILAANNLAWLYAEGHGNLDEALDLVRGAQRNAPERPEVNDTLGWVYMKKDLASLAITAFSTSVAKEPTNPVYRYHLGLAYAKTGDDARARIAFDEALKLRPEFREAEEARRKLIL